MCDRGGDRPCSALALADGDDETWLCTGEHTPHARDLVGRPSQAMIGPALAQARRYAARLAK